MATIACGNCNGAHASVADVRACFGRGPHKGASAPGYDLPPDPGEDAPDAGEAAVWRAGPGEQTWAGLDGDEPGAPARAGAARAGGGRPGATARAGAGRTGGAAERLGAGRTRVERPDGARAGGQIGRAHV